MKKFFGIKKAGIRRWGWLATGPGYSLGKMGTSNSSTHCHRIQQQGHVPGPVGVNPHWLLWAVMVLWLSG